MNSLFFNYATALLELCKEQNEELVEVRTSIKFLVELFRKNRDFAALLNAPNVSNEEKCSVIDNVFNEFQPILINFLKLLINKGRAFYIYDILKECLIRFNTYLNYDSGIIYSSKPLTIENIEKIKNALEEKMNKRIELINEIDPSLIGGFKIKLNNSTYDASIKNKLDNMRKVLTEGN